MDEVRDAMRDEIRMDISRCRATLQTLWAQQYAEREKRRQAARDAVRAAATRIFPRYPAVRRAYLFASAMRPGALRSTSDIDIAIEGALDAQTYFAVWRALELALENWHIDEATVTASATPDGEYDPHHWWRSEEGVMAVFSEMIKIVYYWVTYDIAP